jgi:hypothetical protein
VADDDSALDELFVAGARIHEPSARERTAAARAAKRDAGRQRRRARRFSWRARAGRLVTYAIAIGVVGATWWSMSRSHDGAAPQQPSHVQVLYASLDDAALDASIVPAIRNEIGIVQAWFATQTRGRELDVVTGDNDDAIDVSATTLDLEAARQRDRADAASLVIDAFRDRLADEPDELLLVFVPVRFDRQVRCGEGSQATIAIVWIGSCGQVPSTASRTLGDGTTVTIAHELVHALGAVAECAPHYGNNGHVTDDPHDLMYDGDVGPATPIALDPGHDDYWKSGSRDCQSDISDHPAWRKA